jgi:hypothetical protein
MKLTSVENNEQLNSWKQKSNNNLKENDQNLNGPFLYQK